LYLVGNAAFALRMAGRVDYEKLVVVVALFALYAISGAIAAWAVAAAVAALLGALCAAESETVRRVLSREASEREASTTASERMT
jgi:hypothetical protein